MLTSMLHFLSECLCCISMSMLHVMFYPITPVLAASPGSPFLAILSWQFCSSSPVLPVQLCLSFSACSFLPALHCLSCFACPVLFVCTVLPVLLCLSCSTCPICLSSLPVRFCLSSSICPVCLSSSAYPHCLSCSACPILPFSFLPVPSAGPVQPDLFCMSCCACPFYLSVLLILSSSAVLLCLSCFSSPFLPPLFSLSCPGIHIHTYITHERYRKLGARNTEKAKAQKMKSGGARKREI